MLKMQFRRSKKINLKLKKSLKSRYQMARRMKNTDIQEKVSNCTVNEEGAVKVI